MKYNKPIIIAFLTTVIFGVPWLINNFPKATYYIDNAFNYVDRNIASVFFQESITIAQLQNKYNLASRDKSKIRVLIVPGHEPTYGGAEYGNLFEREMTVELARHLEGFLKNNKHYEVIVSRDTKDWNPDLKNYFSSHWNEIISFFNENKNEMLRLINNGVVSRMSDGIKHNSAPRDVALRLYGINKWVNENDVDIAIHIHFNDYPRRNSSVPGVYSGLAIYVPERQYSNSTTTRAIADSIFKRLTKYNAVSNLPVEESGVIEEQELIAIGTNNTLDAPSMLIEYGYIYESQFSDPKIRDANFKDLAFQTYLGLQDFFGGVNDVTPVFDTLMLPHSWEKEISKDKPDKVDVMALQTALLLEGLYPGESKTKNDCPRSGVFGPCTTNALGRFQKLYGITNENGKVGLQTKSVLNSRYSLQIK